MLAHVPHNTLFATMLQNTLCSLLACSATLAGPAWGQVLNEDVKLLALDGLSRDSFGRSIAINDGIVAVGAIGRDDQGAGSGTAYLFDAATGAQLQKLLPSDGGQSDAFGYSIAIDNGVVAVGAFQADSGFDNNPVYQYDEGAAYLFDAATGAQLAKLTPTDAQQYEQFGTSVALDNGIVAIGAYTDDDNGSASGSAYLFDVATGTQLFKLLPTDGAPNDHFGISIAISGGIVAVGAYHNGDNGNQSGSAYLFDATTGIQTAKLLPADGVSGDFFGNSIAIDNGIVAVGAYNQRFSPFTGDTYTGAAYLFDAATGLQTAKLSATDGAGSDSFGFSVAISNGVVAVGSSRDDDSGTDSGSAYLFDASTGAQLDKLRSSDGSESDQFGGWIAMDNSAIAATAVGDDANGFQAGSAYVFAVPGTGCPADVNGDGVLDNGDIGVFITLFLSGDLAADFTSDGILDNGDIGSFIAAFLAGCS